MSLDYFYDPSYEYVTTTYCDESSTRQLWTMNTTTNMLFTANDTNKCLSMVPNTININLDLTCHDYKVPGGVKVNGILRTAYTLSSTSKQCLAVLQEFGRWDNEQYHTYSNIVTSYDCFGAPTGSDRNTVVNRRRPDEWVVNNQTGTIYNPTSDACLHLGGDAIEEQCKLPAPSPYPAFLFPCYRGCAKEKVQRWIFEPVVTQMASLTVPTQQLYRIKLRGNPQM